MTSVLAAELDRGDQITDGVDLDRLAFLFRFHPEQIRMVAGLK